MIYTLIIVCLTFATTHATKTMNKSCSINIDTIQNKVIINGSVLLNYHLKTISQILGKPTRIEQKKRKIRYEDHGYKSTKRTSIMIDVINYYYVWDHMGLIFYTKNRKRFDKSKVPKQFILFFKSTRQFNHTLRPAVLPKERGYCTMMINQIPINEKQSVIPHIINHRTEIFLAFKINFAPTSYITKIDSIYSRGSWPYIQIFLSDARTHYPSYIIVRY
jgi:hypothetical protein